MVVTFSPQVPALAQLLGQQAQVPPRQPLVRVVRPPVALAAIGVGLTMTPLAF
ncbi:MAG: hypothetical protein IPL05_06935 [Betaproteobacteria bacterium]|nr:hypothetical protein [Betaproteobacteria bacterium]